MALSLKECQDIDELAGVLYDLLPGSGNPRLSFPTVAAELRLQDYWVGGSKRPAIVTLLTATYERERGTFCPLIESIVRKSLSWRAGKGNPLLRDEVEEINRILLRLEYKIPSLHDPDFLAGLERRKREAAGDVAPKDATRYAGLKHELLRIRELEPRRRGYAFERFLHELFDFFDLAPKGSFRLVGEQIDGSFQLDGQTYLLEAKWQNTLIARADLADLQDKVTSKARWSRGMMVSYSGFSEDGLTAFERGRPTSIVAINSFDLYEVLERNLELPDVIRAKAHHAPETNRCYVPVRELF